MAGRGRSAFNHRKRHVVFVADIATVGGAAEALEELCHCLIGTSEYRCTVLTAQDSPFNKRLEDAGVRTVVTHHGEFLVARPQANWKVPVKWTLCLAEYVRGLMSAVHEAENAVDFDDVDVIHTNVPRNDLGMMLASRHSIPHVVHLRECSFSHFRCWSYRRDPVGYLARGADAFVGISQYVTRYWAKLGLPSERICTVYDGVQISESCDIAHCECGEVIRLLFLGGYVEAKGTRDAVVAVALIEKMFPGRVTLDVYGGGLIEFREELERFVRSEGLDGVVRFHGETENVWAVIPSFDIGLACSVDEGFGRTVIEFQACGVPPVVSDSGAFPELVQDGINGLVYEKAGGAKALAKRICDLVDDPFLRHRLGLEAEVSAKRFTAEKSAEGVMALYDDLLETDHYEVEVEVE